MGYLDDLLASTLTLQKDGSPLQKRTVLNFVGDGVTLADDTATSSTTITIPGASAGGGAMLSSLAASTANLTLSGTQTIDGVSCGAGAVVLAKDQTDASENGLYVVAAGAWSRASSMNSDAELQPGRQVYVRSGTANAGRVFKLDGAGPFTLDVSDLPFTSTLDHAAGGSVAIGGAADSIVMIDADSSPAIIFLTDSDGTTSIVGNPTLAELAIGVPSREDTGANDGGDVSISAADGQTQTGGADNTDGGSVKITVGQKGTGGAGADGTPGRLRLVRLTGGAAAGMISLPNPADWDDVLLAVRNHDGDDDIELLALDNDDSLTIKTDGDITSKVLAGKTIKSSVNNSIKLTVEETAATFGSGVLVTAPGTWVYVRRSSDSAGVTNSTTMVDDGVLEFAIGANEEWIVDVNLAISAGAGGGHRETITAPAGATGEIIWNTLASFHAALGTDLGESGTATSGPTMRVWVVNGATPGTVKVRYAQYASDAAATVIKAGSYLAATRVA